eukprot:TRINITY_DN4089_c0_g1_i6.p3 TRINITY_DN4089_c0_g1~~TRINITY_DN4089_c0_g1_i6.p3  ORF type:complete len:286 (-),score=17.01 TRINITY_DN4089_c0_g1_i6:286-1143(-)
MCVKVRNSHTFAPSSNLGQGTLLKTRRKRVGICVAKTGYKQDLAAKQKSQLSQLSSLSPLKPAREFYLKHLERMWEMSTTLPVQVEPPSQRTKGEKQEDFYVNLGYAIRTLREEIPILFYQDLTYDIYRDDVVFRDPRNVFRGKDNYKILFWSLRFHGRIFFSSIFVEVRRIWQLEENKLKMQWTVRAVPRVPWSAEGRLDGYSIYKLDNHGKIYEHQVDNVIFRDPPFQRIPLFASLRWWQVYTPQRAPCPGIQCVQTQPLVFYIWLAGLLAATAWNLSALGWY